MISNQKFQTWMAVLPVFLVIFMLAGCAAKTAKVWGDPQTGLILKYRMAEDQVLKYQASSDFKMKLEVMGQKMEIDGKEAYAFSVEAKGLKEDNHKLGVTIDSMSISLTTPQGELNADMSGVEGKGFDMVLSPLGEEMDMSGAESLKYELEPGNVYNVKSKFQLIFPDLAGRPLKLGDTWKSKGALDEKTSKGFMTITFDSLNTLEGFETVDGLECVKITSESVGVLKGKSQPQPGVDLVSEGKINGTDIWYFAYKEGMLVKVITKGTGETTAKGPQNITIPMTRQFEGEVKLIK